MNFDNNRWDIHLDKDHPFNAPRVQPDLGDDRYSPERYYAPEFWRQEWDKLFTQTWLLAGVVSDIPEEGDWMRFDVASESFIIVRQEDGTIKAHYNVCPHRGSQIALDDFGSASSFTCPFHSWRFGLDGKNEYVTDAETFHEAVLCHGTDLVSVRCEDVAGLVFISMRDDVPPATEWLGEVAEHLALYDIDKMHVIQHKQSQWAANWKGGVDAFYETYHLHAIHPQTQGVMDDRTQIDLFPNGMSRQFVPFAQPSPRFADQETVNEGIKMMLADAGIDPESFQGTAQDSRAAVQAAKRERSAKFDLGYEKFSDTQLSDSTIYGLFPNVQIGCHPEAVFIHRFLPHPTDPDRFTYDTMILFKPEDIPGYGAPAWMGLAPDADISGDIRPDIVRTDVGEPPNLGEVLDQDSDLLPIIQKGSKSRGFKGALWSEQEARLRHFHVTLNRYLNA